MNLKKLPETLVVTVTQDDITADPNPKYARFAYPWLGPLADATRRALRDAKQEFNPYDIVIAPGVGVSWWEDLSTQHYIYRNGQMTTWLRKYHAGHDVHPATFVLKRVAEPKKK